MSDLSRRKSFVRARGTLSDIRRFVEAFFAVVWACRVSIVGLIVPAIVLIYAPQARDLFSYFAGHMVGGSLEPEISRGRIWTLVYWVVFTGFVLAFWCYPVHFSARVLLYDPHWLFRRGRSPSDAELRRVRILHRPVIVWLPRILGASVFVPLAWACYRARADVPGPSIGALEDSRSSAEITRILWLL